MIKAIRFIRRWELQGAALMDIGTGDTVLIMPMMLNYVR